MSMQFLGQIGIDPVLLFAQIVNFGLLLWILTRFLYRPIIDRIERDEKILKGATTATIALESKQTEFNKQKADLARQSRKLMKEAQTVADDMRKQIIAQAQQDARALLKRDTSEMAEEKKHLQQDVERRIRQEFPDALARTLKTELSPSVLSVLGDAYFSLLLKRISDFPDPDTQVKTVQLQSATKLTDSQLTQVQHALKVKFGHKATLEQRVDAGLLSGFRLSVNGTELDCDLLFDLRYAIQKG